MFQTLVDADARVLRWCSAFAVITVVFWALWQNENRLRHEVCGALVSIDIALNDVWAKPATATQLEAGYAACGITFGESADADDTERKPLWSAKPTD